VSVSKSCSKILGIGVLNEDFAIQKLLDSKNRFFFTYHRTMKKIKKLVVANRGEIALRIMRTAREMGISTVAVYSEADRHALHVRFADEAVSIGGPLSSDSYLRGDKIIEIALASGADAIHPGYGFLSENTSFARNVQNAGLIFVGPSPTSIEVMGNKLAAKKAVADYGIPMVPGTADAITNPEEAKKIAQQIGYPILIKASAGGGGKGMRIVEHENDFDEQMKRAVSEALSSFGDGSVFIEKYITSPKHIEVQVLGDQFGSIVHLFERECSIQRRHQKVIEEAPSPVITQEKRREIGDCAIRVAEACGYYSAGTVEFIVDQDLNYYFLEMNTRLQVEHPVTELITGIDLVKQMIYIAEGQKLEMTQDDIAIRGHAIEVRVYAEDPANGFLPDPGKLQTYVRPQGSGIRVDDGFEQGMEIPVYYDPMIAKLITYGQTREEGVSKMIRAIGEYTITGVKTTLPFCRFALKHPAFLSGKFDTHFVDTHFHPTVLEEDIDKDEAQLAAVLSALLLESKPAQATEKQYPAGNSITKWKTNRTR
jgi:acetyl-CoA carboxylase biotin carboxylase subunit